jgi:hypothetical protein
MAGRARQRGPGPTWDFLLRLDRFVVVALGLLTLSGLAAGIVGAFQASPEGVSSNQITGVVIEYSTEWAGVVIAALLFISLGMLWHAASDLADDERTPRGTRLGGLGQLRSLTQLTGLLFIANALAAIAAVIGVAFATGFTGTVELDWTRYLVSGGLALASFVLAAGGLMGERRILDLCDTALTTEGADDAPPPPAPPAPPSASL